MRKRTVLYGSLVLAAIGLFVACGDPTPTQPSSPGRSPFAGIEVIGPDSLGAGQSAQFVATIRQTDGTTKSATSMPNLRWSSSNPSVIRVSNSGVVTASSSEFGEAAIITAEITSHGVVQGTRKVVIRPKSLVTAEFEVSAGKTVFALKLTESAGVPATITGLMVSLDSGWSGQCIWTPDKLGQTRLSANGTLELDPLTCGIPESYEIIVEVWVGLKDDNGYVTDIYLWRAVR